MKRQSLLKRLQTIAEATGMQALLEGIRNGLDIIDGIPSMSAAHPEIKKAVDPGILRTSIEDCIAMEIAILNSAAPKDLALDEIRQDLLKDLFKKD